MDKQDALCDYCLQSKEDLTVTEDGTAFICTECLNEDTCVYD